MLKSIEATGATIELAIQAGLDQLQMDRDSVSVEVLEQPKKGFFGIGASPAKVSLTYEVPDPKPEKAPEHTAVTVDGILIASSDAQSRNAS